LDLLSGFYQLHDYATACWATHLEELANLKQPDVARLRPAVVNLVRLRWSGSASYKPHPNVVRLRGSLSPLKGPEDGISTNYDQLVEAVACARKQSGSSGTDPSDAEEALTLWKATADIRSVLESFSARDAELKTIEELYGPNRFKCPRMNCMTYHQGLESSGKRKKHVSKHTCAYLCSVPDCSWGIFGFAVETQLKAHLSEMHCMPQANYSEEPRYAKPQKHKTRKPGPSKPRPKCPDCNKSFSKESALKRHIPTHSGKKPFSCGMCKQSFARDDALKRHLETKHSANKFSCLVSLEDGTQVGCRKLFDTVTLLQDHWQGDGATCIGQWRLENQQAGDFGSEGPNASMPANPASAKRGQMPVAAKRSLPPFRTLLEWCGLLESGPATPASIHGP
jgi:hypothetical protein